MFPMVDENGEENKRRQQIHPWLALGLRREIDSCSLGRIRNQSDRWKRGSSNSNGNGDFQDDNKNKH